MKNLSKYICSVSSTLLLSTLLLQTPGWSQVNAGATADTKRVYTWLDSLRARTSSKVVLGQEFRDISITTTYADIVSLQQETGRWVGMVGHEYNGAGAYDGNGDNTSRGHLIDYWKAGGLVTANWNFSNPFNCPVDASYPSGNPYQCAYYGDEARASTVDLKKLLPNPTRLSTWQTFLDNSAEELAKYQKEGVVVLWRPFQEMNGNWFWWGNLKGDSEGFKAVWRDMYDYFTRVKGLNNLIWVYSPVAVYEGNTATYGEYESFYPGSQYVDVTGPTVYADSNTRTDYNWIGNFSWFKNAGKPIFINEFGPALSDATNYTTDVYNLTRLTKGLKQNYPEAIGVQFWSSYIGPLGPDTRSVKRNFSIKDSNERVQLLQDPLFITRERILK
jgi:mannan endo-1,4-beta-mannosidase